MNPRLARAADGALCVVVLLVLSGLTWDDEWVRAGFLLLSLGFAGYCLIQLFSALVRPSPSLAAGSDVVEGPEAPLLAAELLAGVSPTHAGHLAGMPCVACDSVDTRVSYPPRWSGDGLYAVVVVCGSCGATEAHPCDRTGTLIL